MPKFKKVSLPFPAGSTTANPVAAQETDVIFERIDRHLSQSPQELLTPKGLCVLLGKFGPSSRAVSEWAYKVGMTVMIVGDQPLPMDWLRRYSRHLDFMMVDADYLDDTETTVDFCLQVRRATPALPLILLSSEVRGHDLTCERMAACDVTLKSPVYGLALEQGIHAAYQNNAQYLSGVTARQ